MNALLKDYWLVWRMAFSSRARHASAIVFGLSALGAVVVPLLILLKEDDLLFAAGMSLRVAVTGVVLGWMLYFVPGAVKLNTPAVARLVPRLRRRLIEVTALVWVVAVAMATLLSLNTKLPTALVLLGTGGWIAAFGLGQSGSKVGTWVQFAFTGAFVFHRHIPPALFEGVQHGTGFAVALLLMLAFATYALQAMFLSGGERHYAAREAQILQIERMSPTGQFRERKQSRFDASLYRWVLQRDSATRDSGRLLVHLLGARNHWVNRAFVLAVLLAIAGVALLVLRAYASAPTQQLVTDIGWMFPLPLLLGAMFDTEKRNVRLKDTAGEQALVRLAPRLPAGAPAFNRKVAVMLLRTALLEWAMLAGTVLCAGVMTGASAASLFTQACLCCLTLPLVGASLRDHARRSGLLGWRLLLGFAVSLALSAGAGMLLNRGIGLPTAAGAALASIAIAAVLIALGLRRAETAPYAFPAGRLA